MFCLEVTILLKRPTNTLHSVVGDNDMVLYSPNGTPLTLPRIFLKDSKNIERFVRTAKNNKNVSKINNCIFEQE